MQIIKKLSFIIYNLTHQESSITPEMTWGETEFTQLRVKKTTPNESRCFALTSIDLFDGALN